MIIQTEEFLNAARNIADLMGGSVGFDIETTGLSPYRGAKAFLLGFTCPEGNKFSVWLDGRSNDYLRLRGALPLFFSNHRVRYCAHNAKFEMHFFKHQFGIDIPNVWDTEAMERLVQNNHRSYSLQACAERMGMSKYEPMLAWLKQRGNKGQYHRAPEEIVVPYCEHDAWLSWELCRRQIEQFRHWDRGATPINQVVRLEHQVLPHLFRMEEHGLRTDVSYCMRAKEYEASKIEKAKSEFAKLTGTPFVDSRKTLQPIFDANGIRYGLTGKGNASFAFDAIVGDRQNPIVAEVLRIRQSAKRLSAYWDNFLELEHNGIIRPTINQNRAETGRMSIQEPSCQNWPTDEDDDVDDLEFPVRRAFIARPDCVIVSMDYSQMELRLICDEAGDMGMIDAIKSGRDFHQETADMAGVRRSLAKNGRFAKLYGAGVPRVADTLKVDMATAAAICQAIDATAPEVKGYSRGLINFARTHGQGYNFLGRRYFFPDPTWAYLFPNYRIQGGCGEILRMAICSVGDFLAKSARPETFMLIPIHDELVLNVHRDDLHLLPEIRRLMIGAHRSKRFLEMDVSVHVGQNFYDMEPWHE